MARVVSYGTPIITPASLSKVKIWVSPRNVTETSGVVSQLNDMLGGTMNGTAASGQRGTLTANQLNTRSAIVISGGMRYQFPSLSLGSSCTVISVARSSTQGLRYEFGSAALWFWHSGSNMIWASSGSGNSGKTRQTATNRTQAIDDNLWRINVHQYDGTHAGHTITTNGATELVQNGGGTANPGSLGSGQFWLGARSDGTFPITGALGDFIVATPQLTASEATALSSYLHYYYDVPLINGATNAVYLGDSITDANGGGTLAVPPYALNTARNPLYNRVAYLAVAGNTVEQQTAAWLASIYRASTNTLLVSIMVLLNNLAAKNAVAAMSSALRTLIADIRSSTPWAKIALYTITPARERWPVIYPGQPDVCAEIQDNWTYMNRIIAENAFNVDFVRTVPATNADDGTGALRAAIDIGDHIHPDNTWRQTVYAPDMADVLAQCLIT